MTEFYEAEFPNTANGHLTSQAGDHPFLDDSSWMTQPLNKPYGRRWYDEIGSMTLAIQKTKGLPGEIQKIIAKNLNDNIDYQRQTLKKSGTSLSLGTKTVLGLYKSGLRQRWYDTENPELSRAIMMMSTLPEDFLGDYAQRIMALSDYLSSQSEFDPPKDINRTIETILNQSYTQLEETETGIRISERAILETHNPKKHIVATESKKKPFNKR